jgi:hypothetical protein
MLLFFFVQKYLWVMLNIAHFFKSGIQDFHTSKSAKQTKSHTSLLGKPTPNAAKMRGLFVKNIQMKACEQSTTVSIVVHVSLITQSGKQ